MFFRSGGPGVFQELSGGNEVVGLGVEICLDSISVDFGIEGEWSHDNQCGETIVEDASGYDKLTASISLSFADVQDRNFAIATLGQQNAAAAVTATVTGEVIPAGILVGSVWYAGGKERHFNLTAVTVNSDASPSGALLTLNTDYTLDAVRGKIVFLTAQAGGATITYTHQDPASVALLSAGQKNYQFSMDYYNRENNNQKGALVLYNIKLNPATGLDFMVKGGLQVLTLTGKALADLTREATDDMGQFGFRNNVD